MYREQDRCANGPPRLRGRPQMNARAVECELKALGQWYTEDRDRKGRVVFKVGRYATVRPRWRGVWQVTDVEGHVKPSTVTTPRRLRRALVVILTPPPPGPIRADLDLDRAQRKALEEESEPARELAKVAPVLSPVDTAVYLWGHLIEAVGLLVTHAGERRIALSSLSSKPNAHTERRWRHAQLDYECSIDAVSCAALALCGFYNSEEGKGIWGVDLTAHAVSNDGERCALVWPAPYDDAWEGPAVVAWLTPLDAFAVAGLSTQDGVLFDGKGVVTTPTHTITPCFKVQRLGFGPEGEGTTEDLGEIIDAAGVESWDRLREALTPQPR